MERYIITRDFTNDAITVEKGDLFDEPPGTVIPDDMRPCLLKIDEDIFKNVFYSFGYMNWLKEKASDQDEEGCQLYTGLTRSPETMIMYLMELGLPSDALMRYIYGPGNKYMEYKFIVQEYGKMI